MTSQRQAAQLRWDTVVRVLGVSGVVVLVACAGPADNTTAIRASSSVPATSSAAAASAAAQSKNWRITATSTMRSATPSPARVLHSTPSTRSTARSSEDQGSLKNPPSSSSAYARRTGATRAAASTSPTPRSTPMPRPTSSPRPSPSPSPSASGYTVADCQGSVVAYAHVSYSRGQVTLSGSVVNDTGIPVHVTGVPTVDVWSSDGGHVRLFGDFANPPQEFGDGDIFADLGPGASVSFHSLAQPLPSVGRADAMWRPITAIDDQKLMQLCSTRDVPNLVILR